MSRDLENLLRVSRAALPDPSRDATNRARATVLADVRRRRGRRRACTLLTLAAVISIAVAAGFGMGTRFGPEPVQAARPSGVSGAGFLPASGWNTFQRGGDTIAANVPLDPNDLARGGVLPLATLGTLPRSGTVIVARLVASATPAASSTRLAPLRLDNARRSTRIVQGRRLLVRTLQTRVEASTLAVSVFFGSDRPSAEHVAQAQGQLDRLVVAAPRVTLRVELHTDPNLPLSSPSGRWVELSGTIASPAAGEVVEVLARDCGRRGSSFYRVVGSARTVAGGSWTTTSRRDGANIWGFPINAYFRARWNGAQSEPVLVRVPVFVNAFYVNRRRNIVAVIVNTRDTGQNLRRRYVELQRRVPGTNDWVRVRRARLGRPRRTGLPPGFLVTPDTYWAQFRVRTRGLTLRALVPAATGAPCYTATASDVIQ